MFNPARATDSRPASHRTRILACILGFLIALGLSGSMALAAPDAPAAMPMRRAQNVDWMSSDTAASLSIGMDVLVPTWIPEPFSGFAPSVSASSGYYRLYWMIDAPSPTFLYIEGIAGGGFPAGSPADLNKELTINASVQGWSAIHDIGIPAGSETPIYDQVWWIANGVLYTVSSNNMTGTDSLSLANSLIALSVPQAPAPVPTDPPYVPPTIEVPVQEAPVEIPAEVPVDVPQDPVVPAEEPVSDPVVETTTDAIAEPVVAPTVGVGPDDSGTEATTDVATDTSTETGNAGESSAEPWSPDRNDANAPSDGTSGPPPPVIGGDGTGGLYDTALPRIRYLP